MPTFVLKWVAPILLVLAVVGVIYGKGRLDAKHAAEVEKLNSYIATVETLIATEREAREADAALAAAQAVRLRDLSAKSDAIQEYADALEDARRECLSSADSDRLRDLWN